jgi:hypothetical protein
LGVSGPYGTKTDPNLPVLKLLRPPFPYGKVPALRRLLLSLQPGEPAVALGGPQQDRADGEETEEADPEQIREGEPFVGPVGVGQLALAIH